MEQVAGDLAPQLDEWITKAAPYAAEERFSLFRRNLAERIALKTLLLRSIAQEAEDKGEANVTNRRCETALSALRAELEALEALGLSPRSEAELRGLVADAVTTETRLGDIIERGRQTRLEAEGRSS